MKRGLKYFLIFGVVVFMIVFSGLFILTTNISNKYKSGPLSDGEMFELVNVIDNPFILSLKLGVLGFLVGGVLGLVIWFLKFKVFLKSDESLENLEEQVISSTM